MPISMRALMKDLPRAFFTCLISFQTNVLCSLRVPVSQKEIISEVELFRVVLSHEPGRSCICFVALPCFRACKFRSLKGNFNCMRKPTLQDSVDGNSEQRVWVSFFLDYTESQSCKY